MLQSLDVLEQRRRRERAEHRSMRATFEQSWRLLAPAEQRALAALGVRRPLLARRGARRRRARIVLLSSLVDKSLLQVDSGGTVVVVQLIPCCATCARRPARSTNARPARHAHHFGQWLADTEQALRGAPELAAGAGDARAASSDARPVWSFAAQRDAPFIERATLALMYYFEARGRRNDGIALFSAAERAPTTVTDAGGWRCGARPRPALSRRQLAGRWTLPAAAPWRARRARGLGCLLNLGLARYQRGQNDAARDL